MMRAYLKDIAAFIALLSFIACIAVALSALKDDEPKGIKAEAA